jgi:predicted ribosome quality control (RQC) complex YloA/Tae2 family protein
VDRLNLVELPPDTSRSLCVQEHYNALIHDLEAKRVRLQRERRLRRALKSARRTAAKVAEDMARVERAPTWRRYGELLRSAYGHVEAGARSALVQDYYDPSLSEVEIPLDPKLDLSANIDRYFRRYRKYADARGKVLARQREMERQIHELERAIADPDASVSDLVRNGAISRRRQTQAATRTERAPYHEFLSESGLPILVGRGGRDNDTLTLRISRGRDVWLHAQDWAGAHVIIRLSKGESADHNTLLDAALLAAHYSKGRDDTITDVRYTAAKYVKKAKGAAPGRVTVAGGKTIAVRPDPKRLERLMRSRR